MLIYEKKVDGERHLFGSTTGIPNEDDVQASFVDADGAEVSDVAFTDSFVDDGAHGMIRVSDEKWIAMNIDDTNVIPGGGYIPPIPPIPTKELTGIQIVSTGKQEFNEGDSFELGNLKLEKVYSDGTTETMSDPDFSTCTFAPAVGTPLTTDNDSVTVSYTEDDSTFTVSYTITVTPANEDEEEPEEEVEK